MRGSSSGGTGSAGGGGGGATGTVGAGASGATGSAGAGPAGASGTAGAGTAGAGGSAAGAAGTAGATTAGNAVNASVPSGTVSFSGGGAVATFGNSTKTLLRIIINDGAATCAAPGIVSSATTHYLQLALIGVAGSSPPFTATTYDGSSASPFGVHVEAYLYPGCATTMVASNGGDQPYSVTVTSISNTAVAGTFSITMTEHVSGGKQFPMTGSFAATICAPGGGGGGPFCN
jgi:hypothetical protein